MLGLLRSISIKLGPRRFSSMLRRRSGAAQLSPVKNKIYHTLLQGLMWFSATQTGCRWLISYIEQKKFLAWEPKFYVEFSLPPEFSGGVMEKCLSTGEARTSDLQIMIQVFYHRATAALYIVYKKFSLFLARIFLPFL